MVVPGCAEEGELRGGCGRGRRVLYVTHASALFLPSGLFPCVTDRRTLPHFTAKSKKQRRIAAKRQRALEAQVLATGNLEALAPKIPIQQQSINLPGSPDGSIEDALNAVDKREDLRKAMRKERKAKIKEANYLKSM